MKSNAMKKSLSEAFTAVQAIYHTLETMTENTDVENVQLFDEEMEVRFSHRRIQYIVKADAQENKQFDRYYPYVVFGTAEDPDRRLRWLFYDNIGYLKTDWGECRIDNANRIVELINFALRTTIES